MYLRLPVSKGKNVGQAWFRVESPEVVAGVVVGVAVVVVMDPIVTMVSRGTRDQRMQELAKVTTVATIPRPQAKMPRTEYDIIEGKCIRRSESGHMWYHCNAQATPASGRASDGRTQGQNNSGETLCCLANAMLM